VIVLAELLPGTPLRDLWELGVDEAMDLLLAGIALSARRAREMNRRSRLDSPTGGVRTIRGGMEMLDQYMVRK
jgi:hypothetical protein